jgi:hypothetical protein
MKNIFKALILTLGITAFISCEDYLDINTDPNNPTSESVNPDLMLAGAMAQPHRTMTRTANRLGNIFMQNWAGDATNFTGAFQDEYALNLTDTFYSGIWDGLYTSTATLSQIASNNNPTYSNHAAIAKIMKTYYFQYLVDLYGDIPYSQAHQLGGNLTPSYDDDETVYGDLLAELDSAIMMINNPSASTLSVGSEDVSLQGNMSMWLKVANTLKLKILLRQSSTGIYNSQFASLNNAEFIGVGETVIINPGYADDSGKLNPHYDLYYETGGVATTTRSLVVGTQYAVNFLKGDVTEDLVSTGVYDSRVERIFQETGGQITGFQQGENSVPGGNDPSRLGLGIISSADQDGYILTSSESLLLQAEAAQMAYVTGLPAADALFRDAIRESYSLLGSGDATAYINSSENTDLIGWTGSADKMEAIMTQKWIALNGINGIESWIEYTRTGFPNVPLATTAARPSRPNRLLYPSSEYTGNSGNVPTQSIDDAFSTNVFWD